MKKILRSLEKSFKNKTFVKNILIFCLSLFILVSGSTIIFLSSLKVPDFHSFEARKVSNSTQIYDRTGKILLYDIHQDTKRTDILFEQMGVNIKNATVAIEDSQFYNEGGVRLSSIVRAVLSNLLGGKTQGGSTITQQLVKNTLLTPSKGFAKYVRKVKEWFLAIKIDNSTSKDQILEAYLNEIPYGGNIYGIEAASKTYFNKDAGDLTIAESAYLAAIPQSPTTLSPYGKNKAKLEARKNLVLARELELKFITQAQYDQAKSELVAFVPQATQGIKAPHFVFFIKDYLEQKYGTDVVGNGGLKVITTLDYDLQQKGEDIVKTGALQNEKTWNASNASLVAIDPKTGQILTMVGSRNYFDKAIPGNFNVATASRQPGSSFKPFIYATAFNKGFTPETVMFDLPTEFQTTCDPYGKALSGHSQADCYMPQDFDGKTRGPMSLRNALAQSINIIAVKLFYLVGLKDGLQTAENMGISTLGDSGQYGLTLVIGGGEVNLLDITSAYGVFANNGMRDVYTGILEVDDLNGKVLEQYTPNETEVLPKNTALLVSDILSDNVARTPTFGANSALVVPGKNVAVKTGTTNSDKDAWTIGYTPSIAVGVWAGNNDNKQMKNGGAAVAGPIWNKFMSAALQNLPSESFEKPEPTPSTLKPILRGFWQGTEAADTSAGVHTILYWVNKSDVVGPPPANPASDPQFNRWEIPVQAWWARNQGRVSLPVSSTPGPGTGSLPSVSILEPQNGANYLPDQQVSLKITNLTPTPIQKIDVFINDTYIETDSSPFNFSFTPSDIPNIHADNILKIVAYDSASNRTEASVNFKVQQ